jgi:hypothetical protein
MRYAQIGIAPCGCVVALMVEWHTEFRGIIGEKEYRKDTRQFIRKLVSSGLSIGRIDLDELNSGEDPMPHCIAHPDGYPSKILKERTKHE